MALNQETSSDDNDKNTDAAGAASSATGLAARYAHFEITFGSDGLPVELGRGAMATTYRATDTVLRLPVALKVINQRVAGQPAARARFLREARAAARLHHPNVANVTFHGEQDGECFYAMELVEGETLAERVRRAGVFTIKETLEIGVQVARALAAAEAHGVIHRDLKPSNLMLVGTSKAEVRKQPDTQADAPEPSLHVKVIDWGLAKAIKAEHDALGADHTHGGFVGTPAFASPEQFAQLRASDGEQPLDTRSDIYSLGVTLWYLLYGRVPFVGSTLDSIHARQRALPLEQLKAARVPGCLAQALRSMLAFDPAGRPQSARELLDVLRRCQERCRAQTPAAAHRWRFVQAGAALILMALGVAAWRQHPSPPAPHAAGEKPTLAVLPFENLSPDPANAFFTTGVQDEITRDLARIAALTVVNADNTQADTPGRRDLPGIGKELGARYLLEGNLRRQGDQVQIHVRLSDLRDPGHVWNEQYTRSLHDVFAVQGEIARAVAGHLRATLSDAERADIDVPPTTDLAAYDLYLRAKKEEPLLQSWEGRYRYWVDTGVPLLEQAVARDPRFALAYAELTQRYADLSAYEEVSSLNEAAINHRKQSETALTQAVRLRPDAGEVHLAQALHLVTFVDADQAFVELNLARQALPNNADVENTAYRLFRTRSNWDAAIRAQERVVTLEPRNRTRRWELAETYRLVRRFEDSDREIAWIVANSSPAESLPYRIFRAVGQLEQRADLAPLQALVDGVTPADDAGPQTLVKPRLILALYAHDGVRAGEVLADVPPEGLMWGRDRVPRAWFEALAARLRHDEGTAQAAFARARDVTLAALQTNVGSGATLSALAMIDAALGRSEQAVNEARHACELSPPDGDGNIAPTVACRLAVVYAWTGDPERACETLEAWADKPAGAEQVRQPMYGDFRLNPVWDPLRGHPRFERLVARLARAPVP